VQVTSAIASIAGAVGAVIWARRRAAWRRFARACDVGQQVMPYLSSDTQMLLYALYKQASGGSPPSSQRKRQAVQGVAHLSALEAARAYAEALDELVEGWDSHNGGVLEVEGEDEDDHDENDGEETLQSASGNVGMGMMSTMRHPVVDSIDADDDGDGDGGGDDDDEEWLEEDFTGVPSIAQAAAEDNAERIKQLLRSGQADANEQDNDGLTAMHWACDSCALDSLRVLLEEGGADPSVRDRSSATALHYAALVGDTEATALLLQWGAQLDTEDENGETPAELARENGMLEALEAHVQQGHQGHYSY